MQTMTFDPVPDRFAQAIPYKQFDVLLGSPEKPVFRQDGVWAPETWSQTAVTVAAQKYFRKAGVPSDTKLVHEEGVPRWLQRSVPTPLATFGGETSVAQIHYRLAGAWAYWGWKGGYFADEASAKNFYETCRRLLDCQAFAPNSPQFFNTGLHWAYGIAGRPQGQFYVDPADGGVKASPTEYERLAVSACFISSVEDNLVNPDGIMDTVRKEALIFRTGAGSGANYSRIRGGGEPLSNGGKSSGLMSFLKVFDASAGAIKSGGTCLAPHTLVRTTAGPVPVDQLAASGRPFEVFSWHPPLARYVTKTATAFPSGRKPLVRLLAPGGALDLSFDHPVRLADGTYRPAGDLKAGDLLSSCMVESPHDSAYKATAWVGSAITLPAAAEPLGECEVFDVQVECDTVDAAVPESGHNFAVSFSGGLHTDLEQCAVAHNTRRAAKMVVLDLDHPDIELFVGWKAAEEDKVAALAAGSKVVKEQVGRVTAAAEAEASGAVTGGAASAVDRARKLGVPDGTLVRALDLRREGRSPEIAEYGTDWQSEAYATVSGQNANNSVRVPNAFMRAVEADGDWPLYWRTELEKAKAAGRDPKPCKVLKARELWDKIAYAAWACADPGIQFSDTISSWHTSPAGGEIRASNPCSEFLYIDDTSCNLASLNLCRFLDGRDFAVDAFERAARLVTTVLEISVSAGHFPSEMTARQSYDYRPLGVGFANLGAMLMRLGLPYDSQDGRWVAAAVTALMHGVALRTSVELAAAVGPFPEFAANQVAYLRVVQNHWEACRDLIDPSPSRVYEGLSTEPSLPGLLGLPGSWSFGAVATRARAVLEDAYNEGRRHGFRNGQLSNIAPTGTISLYMDCDTTGLEPDFSLVKYKSLAGGGSLKLVNEAVGPALSLLGCSAEAAARIVEHVLATDGVEGAPGLDPEHLDVFDCAVPAPGRTRCVSPEGHVLMLAAIQPFISGASSKTVNVSADTSVDDIKQIYELAWRAGVKAIAVYRDGSKLSQPLTTRLPKAEPRKSTGGSTPDALGVDVEAERAAMRAETAAPATGTTTHAGPGWTVQVSVGPTPLQPHAERKSVRRPLPDRRKGYTQKARIGGQKLYLRTGEYADGAIGEIFISHAKTGAALQGMTNAFAMAVSIGLQYGVPLEEFVEAFTFARFEPSGIVQGDSRIKTASSIVDYIFRELGVTYLGRTDLANVPRPATDPELSPPAGPGARDQDLAPPPVGLQKLDGGADSGQYDDRPCLTCGLFKMKRAGTCLTCTVCGTTTGC